MSLGSNENTEQHCPNGICVVEIGGTAARLRVKDPSFCQLIANHYSSFPQRSSNLQFELDVDVSSGPGLRPDEDVQVKEELGEWRLRRGDFHACWDSATGKGQIIQTNSVYAIDSVLRIAHSIFLAHNGGFLLHAASAIRGERAFLFSGVSGAGKTTIARLAPTDATLLTDEISYVRREGGQFHAWGTPFTGELATPGKNQAAPLGACYFLEKGPENRIEALSKPDALRKLLRNILFFAKDAESVKLVFSSAWDFVNEVPIKRLIFTPDQKVWDLIR